MRSSGPITAAVLLAALLPAAATAQERAYFVTYDHYLEEAGNLEIGLSSTTGLPRASQASYTAPWIEIEYGMTGWWTTEVYVEGVLTPSNGSALSGWRLENRFRPFKSDHRVNPILYIEYENTTEASRIQKEIVGPDGLQSESIRELRNVPARELEGKLILSGMAGSWNVAGNLITEKNLSEDEGIEFGYALGTSRRLGLVARESNCRWCPENFVVGIELYGGLGSSERVVLGGARHYVAPTMAWQFNDRSTLKVSVGFGLTESSDRSLFRIGWVSEFSGLMRR